MKDEQIINKLKKCIVHIEGDDLYTINKHHTMMMHFKLKNKYPKMCFNTSDWIKDAVFYKNEEGTYKVREKHIVLEKDKKTITIAQQPFDLKNEYEELKTEGFKKLFELDKEFYKTINEYGDTSSFCKVEMTNNSRSLYLYDTSKDRTINYNTRLLIPQKVEGKWYLPTTELAMLHDLGYKHSDVYGIVDGNYILVKDKDMESIVSAMKITK